MNLERNYLGGGRPEQPSGEYFAEKFSYHRYLNIGNCKLNGKPYGLSVRICVRQLYNGHEMRIGSIAERAHAAPVKSLEIVDLQQFRGAARRMATVAK